MELGLYAAWLLLAFILLRRFDILNRVYQCSSVVNEYRLLSSEIAQTFMSRPRITNAWSTVAYHMRAWQITNKQQYIYSSFAFGFVDFNLSPVQSIPVLHESRLNCKQLSTAFVHELVMTCERMIRDLDLCTEAYRSQRFHSRRFIMWQDLQLPDLGQRLIDHRKYSKFVTEIYAFQRASNQLQTVL